MKEILNITELATRLKISRWTLYSWSTTKFIPHIKLGGRLLFEWEAVEAWLGKNAVIGRSTHRLLIEKKIKNAAGNPNVD